MTPVGLGPTARLRLLSAAAVSVLAFILYRATLLPGLDLGDTASFQVMAGSAVITPRDAYPLFFALADIVAWVAGGDHAHALNLASALEAAIACGLIVLVASELAESVVTGVAVAALVAGSYTFWSQAVITEVYSLHACFVAATLLLLLRWADRPSLPRLAAFFAAYALGFGNHLSMVLLAPGYTLFLLTAAPKGWREVLTPRVVLLAAGLALLGSFQYLWNLRALWLAPVPPRGLLEGLSAFWFDVTKADWRMTTVADVPSVMLNERFRMYWFDLVQQFGWAGPPLAACGAVWLAATRPARAVLLSVAYAANALFAFSYNVGDSHVFFLPSHLLVALLAGCGITGLQTVLSRAWPLRPADDGAERGASADYGLAVLLLVLAAARIWDNYPALDRSLDRRPTEALAQLTDGLDDRRDILVTGLNWQLENGLTYFAKEMRPEVAWTRSTDVAAHAPALITDNLSAGRNVALTSRARSDLGSAVDAAFTVGPDSRTAAPTLGALVGTLAPGTRYVVCVLRPSSEFPLDQRDLSDAFRLLTPTTLDAVGRGAYFAVAGLVGQPPALIRSDDTPFRDRVSLAGVPVDIRMESWLAFDTIRRMGFGQVVAAHHHALIVERGVSFVAIDAAGHPIRTAYAASLFAPQPRFVIRPPTHQP